MTDPEVQRHILESIRAFHEKIDSQGKEIREKLDEVHERVTKIENSVHRMRGWAAGAGAIVGLASGLVPHWMKTKGG